jgi:hypothetical protein
MLINIRGKNFNSEEYALECDFDDQKSRIIGSNNINIDISTKLFSNLIYSYDSHSNIDGIPPEQREYFRFLERIPYGNSALSNIYRSFPIICISIHIDNIISSLENLRLEYIEKTPDSFDISKQIYDNIAIERTGRLGIQPTLYFVKESLLYTDKENLDFLYEFGLLFKLTINLHKRLETYFTPFTLPKLNRLRLGTRFFFWDGILTDREKKINEFAR